MIWWVKETQVAQARYRKLRTESLGPLHYALNMVYFHRCAETVGLWRGINNLRVLAWVPERALAGEAGERPALSRNCIPEGVHIR